MFGTSLRERAAPSGVLDASQLAKFVDPLPIPPIAKSSGTRARLDGVPGSVPFFRCTMREFFAKVQRDLPPTRMWGYDGMSPGPLFEARSGEPLLIQWQNELPQQHLFPIDHSLHGAEESKPNVRTVVHLHGGRTPPQFDGHPELWFTPGQSASAFYPNEQEASALFYHDHAMGITRLNAMAGLFGLYLVRDEVETSLRLPQGLFEIPLILYDRTFLTNGQLSYPVSDNPAKPWVSEFIGNNILVNGKLSPFLVVAPRRYRFRVLNASNAGFYFLSLTKEKDRSHDEPFWQIGSDQGLLAAPVTLEKLFLAPGERADLVLDFGPYAGQTLLLRAQAAVAMQFRVSSSRVTDTSTLPPTLRKVERIKEQAAVKTRELFLADQQDRLGQSHMMLLNGQHWHMPVTEKPLLNSTEIWSFVNLTDDTHPIHLHLVRFQILDRRPFDLQVYQLTKKVVWTGPAMPPDENEMGWKDTVRVMPTLVTRIIVKFVGYPGRYVWHCHVLEHEDNEMMRPYDVLES
jgi:spore coat protein A, manganese oxidase